MSCERGSSLRARISDLVDKRKGDLDPKDAFVKHVWSEVENDYQKMADELASACKEELTRRDVPAAVESRVKSRASIAKSLDRREIYRQKKDEGLYKDIHEILHDLHDLVGIRIIVDYLDHLEAVSDFVTGTFHQELDPNFFAANRKVGQSWNNWFGAYECKNHHVSANFTEANPLSPYNGVIFEIQITSLPANLYNKVAHPLLYKGDAGELSQGDEIVIDLTKGLAFCYSLCTYYKRHKLEGKAIDTDEIELMQKASSPLEGPEFESSISRLAEKIPGVGGIDTKGKLIPRETLELLLKSLLNDDIPNNIGQCLVDKLSREIQDIGQPRIDLPAFGKARFDSQDVFQSPVCQEGTQTRAIGYIYNWVAKGKEPLLWICSHAGSGKSTLARTIARDLTETGQIAAGYFFRRGDVGRNHISHVIPTIAAQLLCTIPHFEPCLRSSIDACKNVDFETMRLDEQFKVLLKSPLSQVGHIPSTKVIIIDALDECVDLIQVDKLIDILASLKTLSMVQIRLLVTSRDEDPIRAAIVRQAHERLLLANTYHDDNITDIECILRIGFQRIRKEARIEPTWPTEEQFREVVHRSTNPSPLFIYATTLLRFLGDGTRRLRIPKKRLKSWIEKSVGTTFTSQLDEMYTTVFENLDPDLGPGSSENMMEDEKDSLRMILGAIAVAVEPLSINSLSDILGLDLDLLDLLKSCRAVLYVPESNDEPVQMLHKSFSDFLLRQIPQRPCWFTIDERRQNGILAQGCVNHLENRLRINICELQDPAVSRLKIKPGIIQKYIPNSLQYASSYWVHHLQKSSGMAMVYGSIESFLHRKFLQWIECLAILGYLDRASSSVEDLRVFCESNDSFGRFLYDAYRFLLKHSPIIGRTPRQVYGSALLFSPTSSIIRNTFWDKRLAGCYNVRNMPQSWDPVLQQLSLSPEGIYVDAIALSPNGKLLASSHSNQKLEHYPAFYIELWQVGTGAHLARARITHEIISICWATDDDNLIVVTKDGHVYRHDFLREHSIVISTRPFETIWSNPCNHMATSPTGVVAIAYSTDSQTNFVNCARTCQVSVWDSYEDKLLHVSTSLIKVSAIAISQDSRQVAVVADGTVKLTDTKKGCWSDLAECSKEDTVLAISSDGERIFILESEAFTIFSISTQCSRAVNMSRNGPFTGLAVSHDETSIMTYSDGLLHWNIEYHNPERLDATLHHNRCSPPDPRLGGSMRIEDTSYTSMITMSPDGQYLVSACDKQLCLWRFPEGKLYKILIPEDRCSFRYDWWCGNILNFSRDGTSILAICNDVVYVWVLEQHERSDVELPANTTFDFSSVSASYRDLNTYFEAIWMNGKTFAIVSFFSVRVCSIENGSCHCYDIEMPNRKFIGTFAFAPGPGLLAIGHDSGVSVLSQSEGILKQTMICLPVTSMSFSPDGSMLLMMCRDRGAMWVAAVNGGAPCVFHDEELMSSPARHLAVDTGAISSDSQFNWPNDQHSLDQLSRRFSFATDGMSVRLASSVVEWYDIQHTAHAPPISRSFPMICQIHTPETETWIQLGSRRVVRIPHGYDTSTISYGGRNVALIDHRGRLVILEFTQ